MISAVGLVVWTTNSELDGYSPGYVTGEIGVAGLAV